MTLSFAVKYRMRFIDFLVAQYGTLNRSAVMDYFGISTVQASNDIQLYIQIAPDNIAYDLSAKVYRKTDTFKRVFP